MGVLIAWMNKLLSSESANSRAKRLEDSDVLLISPREITWKTLFEDMVFKFQTSSRRGEQSNQQDKISTDTKRTSTINMAMGQNPGDPGDPFGKPFKEVVIPGFDPLYDMSSRLDRLVSHVFQLYRAQTSGGSFEGCRRERVRWSEGCRLK